MLPQASRLVVFRQVNDMHLTSFQRRTDLFLFVNRYFQIQFLNHHAGHKPGGLRQQGYKLKKRPKRVINFNFRVFKFNQLTKVIKVNRKISKIKTSDMLLII